VMRLALFAAGAVGAEIASFMATTSDPPVALIVHANEGPEMKEKIIVAARVPAGTVFTSDDLNTEGVLQRLRGVGADIGILAWWPSIIRRPLLEVPRLGFLNFHPSLLPHNRGKHYNFWSILERAPFGVTLHWITDNIDAGDIAFQRPIETTWEDTGETLYLKAQREIVDLFKERFSEIAAGRIPRISQDPNTGSFHHSSELDTASRIDLDSPTTARAVLNILRARTFPPHPAAWFEENGQRYEVRVSIRRTE